MLLRADNLSSSTKFLILLCLIQIFVSGESRQLFDNEKDRDSLSLKTDGFLQREMTHSNVF